MSVGNPRKDLEVKISEKFMIQWVWSRFFNLNIPIRYLETLSHHVYPYFHSTEDKAYLSSIPPR